MYVKKYFFFFRSGNIWGMVDIRVDFVLVVFEERNIKIDFVDRMRFMCL